MSPGWGGLPPHPIPGPVPPRLKDIVVVTRVRADHPATVKGAEEEVWTVAAAALILLVWFFRPQALVVDSPPAPISKKESSRQKVSSRPESDGVKAGLKSKAKPPSRFVLHLVSRPAGALFEVKDGAVLGTAPTTLELPAQENQFRLRASLSGYNPADVICVITAADLARKSGVCTAELQKQTPIKSSVKKVPRPTTLDGYKDNPFDEE